MNKSTYFLFALALIIFIVAFYLYRKSYREILLYSDLINNSHEVINGYEKLSNDLKAAQIYPAGIDSTQVSGIAKVYKQNAGNISSDLARLKSYVLDPLNKKRLDTLHMKIDSHAAWIMDSNVQDTILLGNARGKMQELLSIQNLIDSSIARANTVMTERKNGLQSTLSLNNLLIVGFRIFSLIILVLTIVFVILHARQKEKNRAFLNSVLNSSQNGIISYQAVRRRGEITDFKIVYANDAVVAHSALQAGQIIGKTMLEISPESKTNGTFEKFCKVADENEKLRYEINSPRGIFDVRLAKFMDGVTASFFNITELRNSGEELKKKIDELEQSNYDLEQYAYVASHDLQEPLRKIRIFGGLIRDKSAQQLDQSNRTYLERLIDASERMTNLINELLKFSRLAKQERQFMQVDLNDVLRNVLKDFDLMMQEKNFKIKNDRLPVIEANALQMNQLLYNLVHNAIKFSTTKQSPEIHISSRLLDINEIVKHKTLNRSFKYHEIIFADNGIGFNQEFAAQIFEIFKRLNEQHIYPGSGIGLALCRKIVLNHHGLIWAEGRENDGASFHIVLPSEQPNAST